MRVRSEEIDPELRTAGRLSRFLFPPREWFFRLAWRLSARAAGRDVQSLHCDERRIPSLEDGTEVRLRVYRSESSTESGTPGEGVPGVLFLHGGGYAIGSPEMNGALYETLIGLRDCVVVAPDYRKSPEAPYPAAVHDSYAALLWMKENAAELGIRDDQLAVMGQSAGGGLTAAVTLLARDRRDVKVAFQLPLYPMIDDRNETASARDNNAPVWNERHNRLGWRLYLGDLAGGDVPKYAAPARETDYSGLPPTTTFVGGLDPFRDETIAYVENLRTAGVPVAFRQFEGCYHGFDGIGANTRVGAEANAFVHEQFAKAIDSCFASQTDGGSSRGGGR
jgi:acetyl esterase/lipase